MPDPVIVRLSLDEVRALGGGNEVYTLASQIAESDAAQRSVSLRRTAKGLLEYKADTVGHAGDPQEYVIVFPVDDART